MKEVEPFNRTIGLPGLSCNYYQLQTNLKFKGPFVLITTFHLESYN
jgi:hypothetical protein